MKDTIEHYIPDHSVSYIQELLTNDNLKIWIKSERKTRHGDYRRLSNGMHQITINSNLNPYRFLITLLHEIAHFQVYNAFGTTIRPHGKEWKRQFQHLMLPMINPDVFPSDILPLIANHFKNPRASSDTDIELAYVLKQYDPSNDKTFVFEVPIGSLFKLYNGRVFRKGKKRIKRHEAIELNSGKLYLFNPNAEVEVIKRSINE